MQYLKNYTIKNKKMIFPIYFPDATRAVVRSLSSRDLKEAKVEGLVTNAYHLMTQPGASVIENLGGIKKFMNWDEWIVTDSGGFQVLSLIQRNSSIGKISDKGILFYRKPSGEKKKYYFTPEKSIQVQFKLGADVLICLDDFTPPKATGVEIELSVKRTVEWAKRCKDEFQKLVEQNEMTDANRPILLGVIQGGDDKKWREECAKKLTEIGFDGYGLGGWPLDKDGELDVEIVKFTADLMPDPLPKFALGVGNPQNIVECFKMGHSIFDCVLPTRDARHHRLYVFAHDLDQADVLSAERIHEYLYILRERYVRDRRPISEFCDCYTCQNHSRAYLHHLFRIEDSLAWRLATIHNLRTYTKLIEKLRSYV